MAKYAAGWRQNRELTPTQRKITALRFYQTRHAFSCTSGLPLAQPNALANSGIFATVLFTRYLGMECGLVRIAVRITSGRNWVHQLLEKERKKRCTSVRPSSPLVSSVFPCCFSVF